MRRIRIPGELPRGGDLKVTISVGTLGFQRNEFLKSKEWRPGGYLYVDQDTTYVSFEVSNHPTLKLRRQMSALEF